MKKTNILTSILNMIIQIAYFIWAITYSYQYITTTTIIVFFAMCLFLGQTIVMFIINLVVGIKNRKKSVTSLVIYIIIAVLFIIQLLFFYVAQEWYDDLCGAVAIASYFLICILDIFIFIWTLIKVPKSDKKTKYDTIIFVIVIITVILCLIIRPIWSHSITKKFEEAATDKLNETKYFVLKNEHENTYSFMNDKGEVEFSINAYDCTEPEVYAFENGKKLKFIKVSDSEGKKVIDINDPNNLKEIYRGKSFYRYGDDELYGVKAEVLRDDYSQEEEIKDNNLHEETNGYKNFEESSDYIYTYYSNSDITVQVAEPKENMSVVNYNEEIIGNLSVEDYNEEITGEEPLQKEIYLINNYKKDKIKLDCEDLMYEFDEETGERYINLYDDKYIAFLNKNENTNGYFNLQGEKMAELPNNYVFLDISENCSLVAKVTDENKNVAKKNNYNNNYNYSINNNDYDFENLQFMLINNNLQIISDLYNEGEILDNFYILGSTLWNKNGEKLAKANPILEILNDGTMVAVEGNDDVQIWDTKQQIVSYESCWAKSLHSQEYYNTHEKDIIDVYAHALSQM